MALKTEAELNEIKQRVLAQAQAEVDAQMGMLVRRVAVLTNQLKAQDEYTEALEAEVKRLTASEKPDLHVVPQAPVMTVVEATANAK